MSKRTRTAQSKRFADPDRPLLRWGL